MSDDERRQIKAVIWSLMMSDNMGDVHECVNTLCDALGWPQPEGNYLAGWTDRDRELYEPLEGGVQGE